MSPARASHPPDARAALPARCPVAQSLGLDEAPTLLARSLRAAGIRITRISCGPRQLGRTLPIPPEDTFVAALYLTPVARHELWSGGRPVLAQGYGANALRLVHLGAGYAAHMYEPHEAISIALPRPALDAIADEAGEGRVEMLACAPGRVDPVVTGLCGALAPAFGDPEALAPLAIDHIGLAIATHLMHAYGGRRRAGIAPGGLAPYQERRAKELLAARLGGDLTVAEIAEACGLSRSHFTRAFRASTGLTPHAWLQRHRIERARDLLRQSAAPLPEIAVALGFADQSHFTRVFSRLVGESPAAWRRRRSAAPESGRA